MCSRFSRISLAQAIMRHFGLENLDLTLVPRYNIAPTDEAEVIVMDNDKRRLELMNFGLIPHWAKDPKIALSCLNARSETVEEKPSFRESFRKRRCLVVTDGYYEWKIEGKKKKPHRFIMKNKELFGLAGLWDSWKGPGGKLLKTFSIITTNSNVAFEDIHDRMPVIIEPANYNKWLSPTMNDPAELKPLLVSYKKSDMEYYPVSSYVSNSSNKGTECVVPFSGDKIQLL